MDALTKAILEIVEPKLNESIAGLCLEKMVTDLVNQSVQKNTKVVSVSLSGGEPVKMGLIHNQFENLLKMVSIGSNVLMVGQAGTGKTHGALSVAKALSLPFHSISIGMQTTKSDILGFVDAHGRYNESAFYKAFKRGGIYLMDEIDAGNPNVLILVNSAISNGFCEFPNGEQVQAHETFRFIGTANTFGNGRDAVYVGRNQLDVATLDRFCTISWDIDLSIEESLVSDKHWLVIGRKCRDIVAKNLDNAFISQRALINGDKLLSAGLEIGFVLESCILKGFDQDAKGMILSSIKEDVKSYKPTKKETPRAKKEPEPKEVLVPEIVTAEPEPIKEEVKSVVFDW